MNRQIYIAAPFFNEEQLRVVCRIERILDDSNIKYFSPRLLDEGKDRSRPTASDAAAILEANERNIRESTMVLAWMEYPLMRGYKTGLFESELPNNFKPIFLPDVGVTWEIGCAYSLKVPVIAFYTDADKMPPVNLMLAQSFTGIVRGWEELKTFARILSPYNGRQF